ncbi:MAG: GNAT family N-acetyltransferase [Methyloligellaceae bacterium]
MVQQRSVGEALEKLPFRRRPGREPLEGRSVRLEPVDATRHGDALYASFFEADPEGAIWTYMAYGPFSDRAEFLEWLGKQQASDDPLFFAVIPTETGEAAGMASFMRMAPAHGVIEAGNIWYAPALQRTRAATETIYLMIAHAFDDLGYRRFEWKCDALNAASRRAAERFGFTFEGVFRQHMVIKGRNRDTAWYAIVDYEWPRLGEAFQAWLDDANFDDEGGQKKALSALMPDQN